MTTTIPTTALDQLDRAPATTTSRTTVLTRKVGVTAVLFVVLAVAGSLLLWGGRFTTNMVHDQLAAQGILLPAQGLTGARPGRVPRAPALRRAARGQRPEGQGLG